MKHCYMLILFLGTLQYLAAQGQHALHFDGNANFAEAQNASAPLVNAPGITMTGWVYPSNSFPNFPNFDGIMGFRNELNFDFFLLQLSATTFEARFRNNSNIAFTIATPLVQLNTWQHVAMVYNGTMLRFYYNGVLTDSTAASGIVTNANVPFFLGRLPFNVFNFDYSGMLDEVSLWNRPLSHKEVQCIFEGGIDTTKPGIVAYYPMNQGVNAGNNTTITVVDEIINGNHAVMNNFLRNGPTSNFVTGINQVSTISDSICPGSTYFFNGVPFTQPGTYFFFAPNGEGCDTAIELTLYPDSVNVQVNQNGLILTADEPNGVYQWLLCDTVVSQIPGATNRSYEVVANGRYAVIVDDGSCLDTSDCITINNVGLVDHASAADWFVKPNPASERFFLSQALHRYPNLQIVDARGRLVREVLYDHQAGVAISDLSQGLYFIRFRSSDDRERVLRLMK
jgi:hypothetical protein